MNILVTAPYSTAALDELKQTFNHVEYLPWKKKGKPYSETELLTLIKKHNIEGLITELDEVTEKVMSNTRLLKFIGVCRANPVNVDLDAANALKIPVFHTPARNAQAVTELLIGSLISFYRNIGPSNDWLREEKWTEAGRRPYITFKGNEIAGKTIGFIGFGAVAIRVANILKSFPCNIQFYDPFIKTYHEDFKKETLENIFKDCDIVSVHLPVNQETTGMINKMLLTSMKKDSVFINTARAAVVDQEALFELLSANKIRGAILDVFENEPPKEDDYNLIKLPNVLATPHIAGASIEVEDHHSKIMNQGIQDFYNKDSLKSVFNKAVF